MSAAVGSVKSFGHLQEAANADELRDNKELGKIYNENLALASGIRSAHYVARTIFGLKGNL